LFKSTIVRIFSALFTFLGGILIARTLGSADFGFYVQIIAIITLLYNISTAGIPTFTLRESSNFSVVKDNNSLSQLSIFAIIVFSFLTILVLIAFILYSGKNEKIFPVNMQYLSFGITITWGVSTILDSVSRGRGFIIAGQLSELIIRPGGFVLFFIIFFVFLSDTNVKITLFALLSANIIALIISIIVFFKDFEIKFLAISPNLLKLWLKGCFYNSIVEILIKSSFPISFIIIANILGDESLGIYRAGYQLSLAAGIGLLAAKAVSAPKFAAAINHKSTISLHTEYTSAMKIGILFSIPFLLIFILFPEKFIHILLGDEYYEASFSLSLLTFGIFLNAAVGPIDVLLQVKRQDKTLIICTLFRVVLYIFLVCVLAPIYDILGVAIAHISSLVFWCLSLSLCNRLSKKIGNKTSHKSIVKN